MYCNVLACWTLQGILYWNVLTGGTLKGILNWKVLAVVTLKGILYWNVHACDMLKGILYWNALAGGTLKGILVEVEYLPGIVPGTCWALIAEFMQVKEELYVYPYKMNFRLVNDWVDTFKTTCRDFVMILGFETPDLIRNFIPKDCYSWVGFVHIVLVLDNTHTQNTHTHTH